MDITTATPVEIDTALAALYEESYDLSSQFSLRHDRLFALAERRPVYSKPGYRPLPTATFDEAYDIVCAIADDPRRSGSAYAKRVVEELAEIRAARAANKAAQQRLHDEFKRRGGWTRAFLVRNNGGHIHSSMSCSTCYSTTQFGWLPQVSGHDEAEIVEQAGSDACTVCYPSAPVESLSRARTLLHPSEVAEQAARAEREAKKAARAAAKAAKAITDVDGSPLVIERRRLETLTAALAWLTDSQIWSHYLPENIQRVAAAVAAKRGTTVEEEIAQAAKRAQKRR